MFRTSSLRIFLVLIVFYAFFTHPYATTNDGSRFALTAAIAEHGRLDIGGTLERLVSYPFRPTDVSVFNGKEFSDKPPLAGFLGVPVYLLAHLFTSDMRTLIYLTTLFVSGACAALTCVLLYRLLLGYGLEEKKAAFAAIATGLATNLFYWATIMFGHALTTLLVLLAFCFLETRQVKSAQGAFFSGLAAGLSVMNDYYAITAAIVLFAYCIFKAKQPGMRWGWFLFILGGLGPATAFSAYNYAVFQNPFAITVRHLKYLGFVHKTGLFGLGVPSLKEAWKYLFGLDYGLFLYNPVLLAPAFLVPAFLKGKGRPAFFALLIAAAFLVFLSGIGTNDLGASWGPRYLLPAVPFLMLPLALADKKSWQVFIALAVLSFIINLLAVNASYPYFMGWPEDARFILRELKLIGSGNVLFFFLHTGPAASIALLPVPFLIAAVIWRLFPDKNRGVKSEIPEKN
ncbi:MAG: hypothetical protein M0Z52_13005 [Actinomycetota bacterium]|nr:hypothetical protein [Actinomycetota bacterium]